MGAYDGSKSSYYAKPPFPGETKIFPVALKLDDSDKIREFTVTLKRAITFSADLHRIAEMLRDASESMPMIQAIDVILRHLPSLHAHGASRTILLLST